MKRLRYLLGWVRSFFITDPLIYLYTVVMGTVSLAGSLFDRHGNFQHRVARLWARMILVTGRASVRVEGLENIESGRAYIFCANHLSLIDTALVFGKLPVQFRIFAKKSLFKIPFLGWHLRRSGHMPVDVRNVRASLHSFEQAAQRVREGFSVFFFPEGGRSADGRLKAFKPGPFLLAIKAGVPVVPVAISGTREILPIGSLYIRPGTARLVIGKPIPTEGMTKKDLDRLTMMVRAEIARFLPSEGVSEEAAPISVAQTAEMRHWR